MKIWYVPPAALPDALLFRQHQGLHAVLNAVIAGKPRRGVTRYLRYGGFIAWMHALTVDEMMVRGARHLTPLGDIWPRIPPARRRFDYPLKPEYVRRDITLIQAKIDSPDFRARMNNASLPLSVCGYQLIERQKVLVLENRLPPAALFL